MQATGHHPIADPPIEAALIPSQKVGTISESPQIDSFSFGQLAAMWEQDYVERVVGGKPLVAASTRQKYRNHLHNHILPRWADTPIGAFRAKEVLDWLQQESGSWYMMTDLRNIMSGIFTKAQEWEVLPDIFANPIARVKLPKKWQVYEKRILTEEETVRVLAHLQDRNLLICELCLATGARISEVTGLQVKHVSIERGWIRIEQRNWRGNIDSPKTERSKRTLTLGTLAGRVEAWIDSLQDNSSNSWLFPQHDQKKPMWDSGVRAALKEAAREEKCDFPGFGLHSLRRANITWRQEVGGSSIEASRIAGHASTKMTEEYTVVQVNRQEELTRRIQEELSEAASRINNPEAALTAPARDFSPAGQNGLALGLLESNECNRSIHEQRRTSVPTFIVDSENSIKIARANEKLSHGSESFTTKQKLAALAGQWPGKRLVQIWNAIPGVQPINRFTDRNTAIDRIWAAIQGWAAEAANGVAASRPKKALERMRKKTRAVVLQNARAGSKKAEIMKLLQRPSGVTLHGLMAATGWQAHSVRGFLSAGVRKNLGPKLVSSRGSDGQLRYRVRS
ncbi:MAG: tyrosine-type recombinase/integrase [Acidobacteria bacterium]|nr:tyrosine-type recombinase/integrase [Acidobacteriota bacterium]